MKRLIVPIVIVALAVSAFWFRDRWLPQPAGSHNYLGYVEGEAILVGAPQAGRIASVNVSKGGKVEQGAALFSVDQAQAQVEVARTEATITTAKATYDNLLTGKREPELAVIRAQIEQAEAALDLAQKDYARTNKLASSGAAAKSRRDQAAEQVATLVARLKELRASIDVANLPARDTEIAAALSRIAEAKAATDLARQKLADLSPVAPRPAMVEDIFFDPGEWVSAGQPVVSLLVPDNISLRFFIPESALASAAPGTKIDYFCDGCGTARHAAITKVASVPEYTPPVIYSQGARAKLVYLVEAKPDSPDGALRPGLPIEVEALP